MLFVILLQTDHTDLILPTFEEQRTWDMLNYVLQDIQSTRITD
jgi:hypothetical protein